MNKSTVVRRYFSLIWKVALVSCIILLFSFLLIYKFITSISDINFIGLFRAELFLYFVTSSHFEENAWIRLRSSRLGTTVNCFEKGPLATLKRIRRWTYQRVIPKTVHRNISVYLKFFLPISQKRLMNFSVRSNEQGLDFPGFSVDLESRFSQ